MTREDSIAELIEESRRLREELIGTALRLENFSHRLTTQVGRLREAVPEPPVPPVPPEGWTDDGTR